MSSGGLDGSKRRFDLPHSPHAANPLFGSATEAPTQAVPRDQLLSAAIRRTANYLLDRQHTEGYWLAELEGDTILESEYILLLAFLGREDSLEAKAAAEYIRQHQRPEGGWSNYPGGPLEVSVSVKAYFALKLTGHSPDAEEMVRARNAIVAAGGAEKVNSFTRYYLALLGIISYDQCPAVPPELMLIPRWMPFNIYEMSAWSRTIVIPLSLLWAYKPHRALPEQFHIDELFVDGPERLPVTMAQSDTLDDLSHKTWFDWHKQFRRLDRAFKVLERWYIRPFRKLAVRKAADWMLKRFEGSDGLGAIFPPIIWSVVALKCLGYEEDAPEVQTALDELKRLSIREGDTLRVQPCKSPVWDTSIATLALREAGVSADHPSIKGAVDWLLSKEVRRKGDWTELNSGTEPSGWFFEFNNEFYPDTDDTSMVVMALRRCLPGDDDRDWSADFLLGDWSPHEADKDAVAVISSARSSRKAAFGEVESMTPQLNAIWRGARWLLAMQGKDGGWGAFDPDNNRELFTRVPFADHNAMIDPSTADLTARIVEMFALLNVSPDHPALKKAVDYVWSEQESDHCWYGRWGVNYVYGTWQTLVGLTAVGVPTIDPRIKQAADWLKSKQHASGGWGESPNTYDDPTLRGQGDPTPSQTAWALMGLMAADETDSEAVRRGVQYLLANQKEDGSWDETAFTGTGFPKVFYLRYHYYRIYFPLMALARYARLTEG